MNFLIELINYFINSLNTREIAIIILLIVFLIVIFSIKSVRKLVPGIIRLLFSIKIVIPFIGMVLYISLILFILYSLGFLNLNLIKDVVFWFLIVSIPLFFAANEIKKDKSFFKRKAAEFIGVTTVIGFFINFYTFDLFIEIVLQIILFGLILLIAVSKTDEKYKPVEKLFSRILIIIFACLVMFFIFNLFTNPNELININTVITFVLPGILTILVLPFIYFLALYIEYDSFYVRLKLILKKPKLHKYVFKEVFKKYNFDLYGLIDFLSKFRVFNIQDSEDVIKEILNAEKRVKSKGSETSYSSFKTYSNLLMTFDYPDKWIIDYENTDFSGVYFNSTNGDIRIQIYDILYEGREKIAEIGVIGNKSYRRLEYDAQSDSIAYITPLSDEKELYVRGTPEDRQGLLHILETFELK